jgi:hypothetical protein
MIPSIIYTYGQVIHLQILDQRSPGWRESSNVCLFLLCYAWKASFYTLAPLRAGTAVYLVAYLLSRKRAAIDTLSTAGVRGKPS